MAREGRGTRKNEMIGLRQSRRSVTKKKRENDNYY